jgi:hypothetical protein
LVSIPLNEVATAMVRSTFKQFGYRKLLPAVPHDWGYNELPRGNSDAPRTNGSWFQLFDVVFGIGLLHGY